MWISKFKYSTMELMWFEVKLISCDHCISIIGKIVLIKSYCSMKKNMKYNSKNAQHNSRHLFKKFTPLLGYLCWVQKPLNKLFPLSLMLKLRITLCRKPQKEKLAANSETKDWNQYKSTIHSPPMDEYSPTQRIFHQALVASQPKSLINHW